MHPNETPNTFARFELLTAVTMKATVSRDVMLCSLVECDQCFGVTCCLETMEMEAAGSSKTVLTFYQNTRHHIPENSK
jgi:hypothetical protein